MLADAATKGIAAGDPGVEKERKPSVNSVSFGSS
jgi:hypothetical protein